LDCLKTPEEQLSAAIEHEVSLKAKIAKTQATLEGYFSELPMVQKQIQDLQHRVQKEKEDKDSIEIFRDILQKEGELLKFAKVTKTLSEQSGGCNDVAGIIRVLKKMKAAELGELSFSDFTSYFLLKLNLI